MDNSWKNNNLLNPLKENMVYIGSNNKEYLFIGKRPIYKYYIRNDGSLKLFGRTSLIKTDSNYKWDGFYTSNHPLCIAIKSTKNNINTFLTNLNSNPKIVTASASQYINMENYRQATTEELNIAENFIKNNFRLSKLSDKPYISYAENFSKSDLLFFKKSLMQDRKGNIHSISLNMENVTFNIDGQPIDILNTNKINNLKKEGDTQYMKNYKLGSSFLLSDMGNRYSLAEREAFTTIIDYIKNNNLRLINNISYSTENGNKKINTEKLEVILNK